MTLDITLKQVCDFVAKDGAKDPHLIQAVDNLLGLTLLCAPVVVGPAAAALLPLLAVKNELVKIGKFIFDKLTKNRDDDYVARQERMQTAYGLICFTAFFEALDRQIPTNLRDGIQLVKEEKVFFAKSAREAIVEQAQEANPSDVCQPRDASNPLAALALPFPHPAESLVHQVERNTALWKQMAEGFQQFIQKLAVWEESNEEQQAQIRSAVAKVPEEAARCFEAQYFELARSYEQFAVWANLQEHKRTKQLVADLSEYVRRHAALAATGETIDIGFAKLHETVRSIPETLKVTQATELVEAFRKHYRARVLEPVIEDKDEPSEDKPRLSFPRVCDAFIPQSFRVLRQTGKARPLEDDDTWEGLPRRSDLGAFMLSYLSSPYSTETPLLILGQPGSGKSLLTTVLAAQLMSKHYTAIRVPLREVNAEAGPVPQIEETIRRITHIGVDSWAKLSGAFRNNPPLVIFDGYDELLQASGKVFSGYLKDVQIFQKNEAEQGRPVRAIVTSRVTLIDKATIPSGATVLRLLEFDENQRERWISIWNRTNVSYFNQAKMRLPAI